MYSKYTLIGTEKLHCVTYNGGCLKKKKCSKLGGNGQKKNVGCQNGEIKIKEKKGYCKGKKCFCCVPKNRSSLIPLYKTALPIGALGSLFLTILLQTSLLTLLRFRRIPFLISTPSIDPGLGLVLS
ncbi:hypothetical protein SK128_002136 [Halocaridina rubra]|uniref:Uncharacterized protein n=1 Tax=Halocaridina rubra TaxID=373956 RepID=A0AAN8WFI4_HALRR